MKFRVIKANNNKRKFEIRVNMIYTKYNMVSKYVFTLIGYIWNDTFFISIMM